MSSSSITFTDIKIIDAVCLSAAVVFTAWRITLRVLSGKIWWDDALAVFSAISGILMGTATGMHYGRPFAYSLLTRLAAYYLIAEGFYVTLWTARLSILFSIIRIVPEKGQKRLLYCTAIAFISVLVFLLAQVFWVCETPNNQKWKGAPNPQCSLGLQVAVCQLVTDIIADVLLIFVPVRLLTRTRLERGLKIRLVIIFSATMLTTVVSFVHAAYLLQVRGIDAIVTALVEVSICLIVCNLVVLVPAVYRAFGGRENPGLKGQQPSFRVSSFRFGPGRSTATGLTDELGTNMPTAARMEIFIDEVDQAASVSDGEAAHTKNGGSIELTSLRRVEKPGGARVQWGQDY
ncbi:hypothetical protein K439DRAFT_586943 [Ramaria rubella]|nr:hypothetical protein K439DRAFT_586943 [Ramaria rubella]